MPNQCGEVSIDSNPVGSSATWGAAENVSTVTDKAKRQGSTIVMSTDGQELVPSNSLQPPLTAGNQAGTRQPYQEVQMFVGEFARAFAMDPRAAIFQIRLLLDMMYRVN